jgi:hypothetical protein
MSKIPGTVALHALCFLDDAVLATFPMWLWNFPYGLASAYVELGGHSWGTARFSMLSIRGKCCSWNMLIWSLTALLEFIGDNATDKVRLSAHQSLHQLVQLLLFSPKKDCKIKMSEITSLAMNLTKLGFPCCSCTGANAAWGFLPAIFRAGKC